MITNHVLKHEYHIVVMQSNFDVSQINSNKTHPELHKFDVVPIV